MEVVVNGAKSGGVILGDPAPTGMITAGPRLVPPRVHPDNTDAIPDTKLPGIPVPGITRVWSPCASGCDQSISTGEVGTCVGSKRRTGVYPADGV